MKTVVKSSPSNQNDEKGRKSVKDLLMNSITSDMDSHEKDSAWYQKETIKLQKLTNF